MDNPLILHFITVTIFSLMFAIGVNHSHAQLTNLWRRPRLLLRSLLAVIGLVPLVVFILLWLFDLPPAVAAGLTILAAAPGAPLTYKRTQMAGGDPDYVASLQLTLALLAVLVTPLILAIFYALFVLPIERVSPLQVMRQVGQVTFLPVIAGLLIQRLAPKLAKAIAKPVKKIADALFILLLVLIVVILATVPDVRAMLNLGVVSLAAVLIMAAAALAIGHFSVGPSRQLRGALATACVARNLGLALYITGLFADGQQYVPTLLAYMIVGAITALPYGFWNKRQMRVAAPPPSRESDGRTTAFESED